MKNLNVKANEIVFKQGDASDCMYLVKSGLVGVYVNYGKGERDQIAVLGKGKFFGEMGVIDNQPRSAEIVAIDNCELIEIKAEDFPQFVAENTDDVISMMKNLSLRLRRTTSDLEDAGRFVSRFMEDNKGVSPTAKLKKIIDLTARFFGISKQKEKAPKARYEAGEVLFSQGDAGSVMFQILDGEAGIYRNYGKEDQTELAVLGKGAILGEMAVIEEEKRTATVVAKTALSVNTVANSQLRHFLASHPEDALKILRNISSKLRGTTKQYVETLASIAEFVNDQRGQMGSYVGGDDFMSYANRYDIYASDYNLHLVINPFDPMMML